jgi:hypothetical protein
MNEIPNQTTTMLAPIVALALWIAFWLGAVNWKKTWPVLRIGGWAPAVLMILISASVWSRLAPSACGCLQVVTIPNYWWQLGVVSTLAAVALLCGWLQGCIGWTPTEHAVEPVAAEDHGHGLAHH